MPRLLLLAGLISLNGLMNWLEQHSKLVVQSESESAAGSSSEERQRMAAKVRQLEQELATGHAPLGYARPARR